MKLSVDPWDPSYGTSLDPSAVDTAERSEGHPSGARAATDTEVHAGVEMPHGRWAPVPPDPSVDAPDAVLFVDGVRRVDAQVWVGGGADGAGSGAAGGSDGAASPGLCASYAAGVVCCCAEGAHLVRDAIVRRRGMFTTAAGATDVATSAGTYRAVTTADRPDVAPMQLLSLALQRDLAEAELVAAGRAREPGAGHTSDNDLLVVDGPLFGRENLPRTLGFVKSHRSGYLAAADAAVVPRLGPGERTPVFRLVGSWERYTWYLRLPCPPGAPWAGVVRVECAASLSPEAAVRAAATSQRVLPRFASVPYKDSRAPQNLYPIGGLERELRRRLGDTALLYRALRRAASGG